MLTSHLISRFIGLCNSVNPFSGRVPEGALSKAQNVVIRQADVLEPRRGYSSVATTTPVNAIGFKDSKTLALTWDNPGSGITGQLRYYSGGSFTSLPMTPGGFPFDRPGGNSSYRTRFVSVNKAAYFQSRYGLTKIEDLSTGVCRPAIQPAFWVAGGLNGGGGFTGTGAVMSLLTGGSTTWLSNNSQVAYRFTICRLGANGELIESEPSSRMLLSNTGGSTGYGWLQVFQHSWLVPPDAFYRLYRSKQVATGTDPSDEMFLVGEIFPSTATLDSNGYIAKTESPALKASFFDFTPDSALYLPLYTNPLTGEGISQANTPAPLAADMAYFKNRLYFFNTQDVQRLIVKIIGTGTGGTGGLQDGDAVFVNGVKFTFKTSPNFSPTDTQLYTSGTVAQNIENTARQLVCNINAYFRLVYTGTPVGAVLATYISTSGTDAGQVMLQSILPGSAAFAFQSTSSSGWDADYTVSMNSSPSAEIAGLMWSKLDQPEAVPLANSTIVGDASVAGLRCIALKDAMFLFKDGDGLWKVVDDGTTNGPIVSLVDPTIRLMAPESAVAIDNLIIAVCEDGVRIISEMGTANISEQKIQKELLKLIALVGHTTFSQLAHAIGYQSDHLYVLSVPESAAATFCTRQYCYSLETSSWTSWTIPGTLCGDMIPDSTQLVWGLGNDPNSLVTATPTMWTERKNFDSTDYQDPGFSVNCPAEAAGVLVFAANYSTQIAPGDVLQQNLLDGSNRILQGRVASVTYSSSLNQTTVTLVRPVGFLVTGGTASQVSVVHGVGDSIRLLPIFAEGPLTVKDWSDCLLSFRYLDADTVQIGFSTELYPITDTATETLSGLSTASPPPPVTLTAWPAASDTTTPFGSTVWDRQTSDVLVKCSIPAAVQQSAQLTLTLSFNNALSRYELNALDVRIAGETDRAVR